MEIKTDVSVGARDLNEGEGMRVREYVRERRFRMVKIRWKYLIHLENIDALSQECTTRLHGNGCILTQYIINLQHIRHIQHIQQTRQCHRVPFEVGWITYRMIMINVGGC